MVTLKNVIIGTAEWHHVSRRGPSLSLWHQPELCCLSSRIPRWIPPHVTPAAQVDGNCASSPPFLRFPHRTIKKTGLILLRGKKTTCSGACLPLFQHGKVFSEGRAGKKTSPFALPGKRRISSQEFPQLFHRRKCGSMSALWFYLGWENDNEACTFGIRSTPLFLKNTQTGTRHFFSGVSSLQFLFFFEKKIPTGTKVSFRNYGKMFVATDAAGGECECVSLLQVQTLSGKKMPLPRNVNAVITAALGRNP